MTTRRRATVEETLSNLCEGVDLDGAERDRRLHLFRWCMKGQEPALMWIPHRVWRAFYNKLPGFMLDSQEEEIRALGQQFKAEDDAATACGAIDDVLASIK